MHKDEHQTFLQADTIAIGGHSQTCQKHPEQQLCNILAII